MERSIEKELKKWKESSHRYPLLLRGARQVGKTYVIENLRKDFESFEMVNFEAQPEAMACFESLNPLEIVQASRDLNAAKNILALGLDGLGAIPRSLRL